jgi:hypothetical protein
VLKAEDVLKLLTDSAFVMGVLDSGPATLEHVSVHNTDGPDVRLDKCPCDRKLDKGVEPAQLGEGQYVSSPRHTLGDLVRDVSGEA